jgi:hypothetical protein
MKAVTEAQLHEDRRRQLWIGIATAVARSDVGMTSDTPANYADKALDRFDKRFAKPEDDTANNGSTVPEARQ